MVDAAPFPLISKSPKSTAVWTYFPSTTTVVFGSCDYNTWSMELNTLSYGHKFGTKTVSVWAVDNDSVYDGTQFILEEGPRPSVTETLNQSQCPPLEDETLWIRIDPIGTQYDGEIFTISGTTNIEAGKEVIVDAVPDPSVLWSGNDAQASTGYYYTPPTTTVRFGTCGNNLWSMDINTASYSHKYGKKTAIVYAADNRSVSGSASFTFEAVPRPSPADTVN